MNRHVTRLWVAAASMVTAVALAFATGTASASASTGPAQSAALTAASGHKGEIVKVTPRKADNGPKELTRAAPQLVGSQSCGDIQARLRTYAAQGKKTASCVETGTPAVAGAKTGPNPSSAATAAAADDVWCAASGLDEWWYTRSSVCIASWPLVYTLYDTGTGLPLGTANLEMSQSITLASNSGSWTESDSITMTTASELIPSIDVSLVGACGGGCTMSSADAWGTEPLAVGETVSGTLAFNGNPPSGGQMSTAPSYVLTATQPGTIPLEPTVEWSVPTELSIRCDRLVGSTAGCVVPLYTPTLPISATSDGSSAVMIAWAQQYLPDAWGGEYEGGSPLQRLADDSLAETNRSIICDKTFVKRSDVLNDSCDEYPFAKSYQSGAMLGLSGSDCAEVLPLIDPVTGQWEVEYLNNVTFTERCVRGHVQLESNTDVGGDLGRFAVSERLLDFDDYWVGVTE